MRLLFHIILIFAIPSSSCSNYFFLNSAVIIGTSLAAVAVAGAMMLV
jgi:hypothetical protein